MYCTKCGKEIMQESEHCTNCGNKVQKMNNEGKITIKRNKKFTGWIMDLSVYIDGVYIGSVQNGASITRDISFGKHDIAIGYWAGQCKQQIEVKSESPKMYIEVEIKMGILTNKPQIVNIKEEK